MELIPHQAKQGVDFPYHFEMGILFSRGLANFHPWYFLDGKEAASREGHAELQIYAAKTILFCQKFDGDDSVAVFDVGTRKIICIDLESGETLKSFETFWDFFRFVVDEMIKFDDLI